MKSHAYKGFTLVEVMVAIVILTILAMGGGAVLIQTGRSVQIEGDRRLATEWARAEMEVLKNLPYSEVQSIESDSSNLNDVNELKNTSELSNWIMDVTVQTLNPLSGTYPADAPAFVGEYLDVTVRVYRTGEEDAAVILNMQRARMSATGG